MKCFIRMLIGAGIGGAIGAGIGCFALGNIRGCLIIVMFILILMNFELIARRGSNKE